MHQNTFHELENRVKRPVFPLIKADETRGEAESGLASGESAAKNFYYFSMVFAADSPLASVPTILSLFILFPGCWV
jgi:hypothetical protein